MVILIKLGCNFDSGSSNCYGGGFDRVYADPDGYVSVAGSSSESCDVHDDGDSGCYEE